MSDTPAAAPTRCYHYDDDGTPWRSSECTRETCPDVPPSDDALWASATAPKTALPDHMYGKLHLEKRAGEKSKMCDEGEMCEGDAMGAHEAGEPSPYPATPNPWVDVMDPDAGDTCDATYGDDWQTDADEPDGHDKDDSTWSESTGARAQRTEGSTSQGHDTSALDVPNTLGNPPQSHPVPRLKPLNVTVTGMEARRRARAQFRKHHIQWKERIRLVSACATSSETITSLTADIKRSTTLLTSRRFLALDATDQTRLTREHTALLARLEDEKILNAETRARVIGARLPLPLSSAADEGTRERVVQTQMEKEVVMAKARAEEKLWQRKEREREKREQAEKQQRELQLQLQERELGAPPKKKKTRRKKAKRKNGKDKETKGTQSTQEKVSTNTVAAREGVEEWEDEKDTEPEEGEVLEEKAETEEVVEDSEQADEQPEEGEVAPDAVIQQEKLPAVDEDQQSKKEQHEQHELVRSRMVQLSDKIAMMKTVLGEICEMTKHRAAQQQIGSGASQSGPNQRKRKFDVASSAEADEDVQVEQARVVSAVPLSSPLPSSPHHELASAHQVHAARLEIEQSVRQVADIHDQADVDFKAGMSAGLVQFALNKVHVQNAAAARERELVQETERAAVHAEVTEGLAQVTNKTVGFDAQVREADVTLAGCFLCVDGLEQLVEQESRRRDEARTRVVEMKFRLKSYAALQVQNTAAISSLRTTLAACTEQPDVSSPRESAHPPASTSLMTPMYPTSRAIAKSLAPSMADTAHPLLNHARREISGMLKQNSSRFLRTFDARMQQTLDIVEEFTRRPMSSHAEACAQAPAGPLANVGSDDSAMRAYPASSINMPSGSSHGSSASTRPTSHFSSIMSPSDSRPPSHDYTLPTNNYQRCDPSTSLFNITNATTPTINMPYANFDPSPNMEIPLPKSDMPYPFNQASDSDQLDCSFLADPDLRGAPVRLKYKDTRSGVSWPLVFVKIIPPASSHGTSGYGGNTSVEVQDCRTDSIYNGKIYRFPLNVLSYVPPTAKNQVAVCVAPGVDRTRQYYVLGFNAHNEAIVRRHPKVPNAMIIYFATHMLAQVAPPSIASAPAAASRPLAPSNAAANPKVHVDYPPPMWLKDLEFSGVPIQLQELDGDGSILELISTDAFTSTVVVRPLVDYALQKCISLNKVRHIIPSARHQMVVAIAGYSKGLIMTVEAYGEEECILYSPLKRRGQAKHLEQRYKTAELAVISPSRKC